MAEPARGQGERRDAQPRSNGRRQRDARRYRPVRPPLLDRRFRIVVAAPDARRGRGPVLLSHVPAGVEAHARGPCRHSLRDIGDPREGRRAVGQTITNDAHVRAYSWTALTTDSREADAMRKLTFAMNLSVDGYIAAPGDDLGWSLPSDELFQWWSDRVGATGLSLYGRKLWQTMSSHWPTADQKPGATPAQIQFARRWRDMPKVVFSSTTSAVNWNARLVTGDAVTEITRLKTEDGGPMDVAGATLAAAAMRAGLIDEYT